MNPGYLALLIQISMVLLIIGGWNREICAQVSMRWFLLFVAVSAVSAKFTVPIGDVLTLQLSDVLYGIVAIYAISLQSEPRPRAVMSSAIVLLIGWSGSMAYIHRWSSFVFIDPRLDLVLGSAVFAAIMLRGPLQQFAALWLGVTIGDIWEQGILEVSIIRIGGLAAEDQLWLSVLFTRVFSLLYEWILIGLSRYHVRNK